MPPAEALSYSLWARTDSSATSAPLWISLNWLETIASPPTNFESGIDKLYAKASNERWHRTQRTIGLKH
jgi:hypothetical protein